MAKPFAEQYDLPIQREQSFAEKHGLDLSPYIDKPQVQPWVTDAIASAKADDQGRMLAWGDDVKPTDKAATASDATGAPAVTMVTPQSAPTPTPAEEAAQASLPMSPADAREILHDTNARTAVPKSAMTNVAQDVVMQHILHPHVSPVTPAHMEPGETVTQTTQLDPAGLEVAGTRMGVNAELARLQAEEKARVDPYAAALAEKEAGASASNAADQARLYQQLQDRERAAQAAYDNLMDGGKNTFERTFGANFATRAVGVIAAMVSGMYAIPKGYDVMRSWLRDADEDRTNKLQSMSRQIDILHNMGMDASKARSVLAAAQTEAFTKEFGSQVAGIEATPYGQVPNRFGADPGVAEANMYGGNTGLAGNAPVGADGMPQPGAAPSPTAPPGPAFVPPKTRDEVMAYQRARGLVPDGIVGPRTQAAIAADQAAAAAAPPGAPGLGPAERAVGNMAIGAMRSQAREAAKDPIGMLSTGGALHTASGGVIPRLVDGAAMQIGNWFALTIPQLAIVRDNAAADLKQAQEAAAMAGPTGQPGSAASGTGVQQGTLGSQILFHQGLLAGLDHFLDDRKNIAAHDARTVTQTERWRPASGGVSDDLPWVRLGLESGAAEDARLNHAAQLVLETQTRGGRGAGPGAGDMTKAQSELVRDASREAAAQAEMRVNLDRAREALAKLRQSNATAYAAASTPMSALVLARNAGLVDQSTLDYVQRIATMRNDEFHRHFGSAQAAGEVKRGFEEWATGNIAGMESHLDGIGQAMDRSMAIRLGTLRSQPRIYDAYARGLAAEGLDPYGRPLAEAGPARRTTQPIDQRTPQQPRIIGTPR